MATERESMQLNKLREQNDLAPLSDGFSRFGFKPVMNTLDQIDQK
jgi:hypothetical protein